MDKALKGLLITLLTSIGLFALIYILLGFYYKDGFPCFTWINGVYCTGKSVSEVNEELVSKYPYDGIKVTDLSGAELFIKASDVDLKVDFTESLNDYLKGKNSFAWGIYFFKGLVANFAPTVSMNENLLMGIIADWEIFIPGDDLEVSILKTNKEGYVLLNGHENVPQMEPVMRVVYEAMIKLRPEINLSSYKECYEQVELDAGEQNTVRLFNQIDTLQTCGVTYSIAGEELPLTKDVVSKWILTEEDMDEALSEIPGRNNKNGEGYFISGGQEKTISEDDGLSVVDGFVIDDDGNLFISEKKLYEYISELALSRSTASMMEKYRNGETDTIIINDNSKGIGTVFDVDAEFDFLKNAFINGENQNENSREFMLLESAKSYDASENIGDTYIEINMGKQELNYYLNGNLQMTIPVVTGNVNRGRGTPTGIYPVYNKRYHTNLVGVDYVSYVNYWLGVHKGVGIHDATWRSKFGEEIYKRDGSHGCINCPLDKVEVLWNEVEIGTPVVLYY